MAPPPFPPGLLARYEILDQLGEGGMGVVYRGRQLALDREVAIKLLKSGGAEDEQRFVREGRLLASLACPQIVRIIDADADHGRLWLVCELVAGETLAARHVRAPLALIEALDIVAEVARGLEVAHERGIVHRDVKPDNVILAGDNTVKLADFGLARETLPSDDLTTAGMLMGTPHFIAPEQVRGLPATPASDQYALGVMLYWLATGAYPVDGASPMAVITAKATAVPRPAHDVSERVPPRLSEIAARALALEPGDRFESVAALAAALEPLRVELTPRSPSRPMKLPPLAPRSTRKASIVPPPSPSPRRSMRAVAGAAAIAIAAALAAAAWRPAPEPRTPATLEPPEIRFVRADGAAMLEVPGPPTRALALELLEATGARRLVPALPVADASRFRVEPDAILGPVTLRVTAVDGAAATTDVRFPGLLAQFDELASLAENARKALAAENLRRLSRHDRSRTVRRMRDEWARRAAPLAALAPALLDAPSMRLETKHAVFHALTPLRVIERYALLDGLPRLLPDDALGRTFATGIASADELSAPPALRAEEPFAILASTPDGGRDLVRHVMSIAVPSHAVRALVLAPPPPPPGTRALLELDTGSLAPRDLLWLNVNGWRFLITTDAQVRRAATSRLRQCMYQALDPRVLGRELRTSAQHEELPGAGGVSELRTVDHFVLYYLPR